MRVRLFGTRGSLASAGPETVKYGGDTSASLVTMDSGQHIVLDAGSGVRRIGVHIERPSRVDVLLTHLHMDHIQGLGFFRPVFDPDVDVHIWGPVSTSYSLRERLGRYLSPPLFPVRIRELQAVELHDVNTPSSFTIGDVEVRADLITHPGPTLGYRLEGDGGTLTYIPDHEPALGEENFPPDPSWTSGYSLARGADVLIHDAQYDDDEYEERQGWGHTSYNQLLAYGALTGARTVVTFHHDPAHSDERLDELLAEARATEPPFDLVGGTEGLEIEVGSG